MSAADVISVVIAASAVVLALVVVPLASRRREHSDETAPTDGSAPIATDRHVAPAVTVHLLVGADARSRWRLSTSAESPSTTIDIFTYRPHDRAAAWCHELLDAPLVLAPSSHRDLVGPSVAGEVGFDVAVGWTADGEQESRFLIVRPTA